MTTDLGSADEGVLELAVQPDGKIVVLAFSGPRFDREYALARYTSDGMPDPLFDGDGIRPLEDFTADGLALQPDGKILAAGSVSFLIAVVRLNSDGSFDMSFGDGGLAVLEDGPEGGNTADAIAPAPDGKIVVAGWTDRESELGDAFALRLHADGSPDESFGYGGLRLLSKIGDQSGARAVASGPAARSWSPAGGKGVRHATSSPSPA